ncbi:MAG: hypothetical protein ACK5MU_03965 [Candidatus Saccharimonadales bacterium]
MEDQKKSAEDSMSETDRVTQEDGWTGIYLPSVVYDLLAFFAYMIPILSLAYLGVAYALNLSYGLETMGVALAVSAALNKMLDKFKLNYNKAKTNEA